MHGWFELQILPRLTWRVCHSGCWRSFGAFALALLLGAALPRGAWAQPEGVTDAEVVIGQSCQLSGPLAALSGEVRQGAKLYFDQIGRASCRERV